MFEETARRWEKRDAEGESVIKEQFFRLRHYNREPEYIRSNLIIDEPHSFNGTNNVIKIEDKVNRKGMNLKGGVKLNKDKMKENLHTERGFKEEFLQSFNPNINNNKSALDENILIQLKEKGSMKSEKLIDTEFKIDSNSVTSARGKDGNEKSHKSVAFNTDIKSNTDLEENLLKNFNKLKHALISFPLIIISNLFMKFTFPLEYPLYDISSFVCLGFLGYKLFPAIVNLIYIYFKNSLLDKVFYPSQSSETSYSNVFYKDFFKSKNQVPDSNNNNGQVLLKSMKYPSFKTSNSDSFKLDVQSLTGLGNKKASDDNTNFVNKPVSTNQIEPKLVDIKPKLIKYSKVSSKEGQMKASMFKQPEIRGSDELEDLSNTFLKALGPYADYVYILPSESGRLFEFDGNIDPIVLRTKLWFFKYLIDPLIETIDEVNNEMIKRDCPHLKCNVPSKVALVHSLDKNSNNSSIPSITNQPNGVFRLGSTSWPTNQASAPVLGTSNWTTNQTSSLPGPNVSNWDTNLTSMSSKFGTNNWTISQTSIPGFGISNWTTNQTPSFPGLSANNNIILSNQTSNYSNRDSNESIVIPKFTNYPEYSSSKNSSDAKKASPIKKAYTRLGKKAKRPHFVKASSLKYKSKREHYLKRIYEQYEKASQSKKSDRKEIVNNGISSDSKEDEKYKATTNNVSEARIKEIRPKGPFYYDLIDLAGAYRTDKMASKRIEVEHYLNLAKTPEQRDKLISRLRILATSPFLSNYKGNYGESVVPLSDIILNDKSTSKSQITDYELLLHLFITKMNLNLTTPPVSFASLLFTKIHMAFYGKDHPEEMSDPTFFLKELSGNKGHFVLVDCKTQNVIGLPAGDCNLFLAIYSLATLLKLEYNNKFPTPQSYSADYIKSDKPGLDLGHLITKD
ncbi:hypothetical protein K502DRAFT_325691 [Neoconidiobolus thromboides FSU 785]|nr:hypothetical protein K502DRAFT_325691 [Neoconidiobolus thromboides FSU 785]